MKGLVIAVGFALYIAVPTLLNSASMALTKVRNSERADVKP